MATETVDITTAIPAQSGACVLCGKVLSSSSSLKRHLTTVHKLSPTPTTVEPIAATVDELPAPVVEASTAAPALSPEAPATPARKRRGLILAGAVVAVVAGGLVVSKAGGEGGPATTTLHGQMALMQDTGLYSSRNYITYDSSCEGTGGYSDMSAGGEVTIHDAHDTVVATGHLQEGTDESGMCVFSWSIPDVPVQKFYGVQITHRGTITFTAQDAEGSLDTSLGK